MNCKLLLVLLLLNFGLSQASSDENQKDRYTQVLVASSLALNTPQITRFELLRISDNLVNNDRKNRKVSMAYHNVDVYNNAKNAENDLVFDYEAYIFNAGNFSCCTPCCYFLCCWPCCCQCPSQEDIQLKANNLRRSIDIELGKQNVIALEIERENAVLSIN